MTGGRTFWIIFAAVLQCSPEVLALRDVRIWGPEAVPRGGKATLRCLYELEGDSLYSIKWYRAEREFCRYSPRENPPLKVFPIPGIDVDLDESDATRLTLRQVSRAAAGRYMCEVSADAPSFHTAQVNFTMHVVDIPTGVPVIKGVKSRYSIGTLLRANCSARNSMPPANLSWYINDVMAHSKYIHYHVIHEDEGLMTATSSIGFVLTPKHFLNGKIKIRCRASLFDLYWKSTEKSGELERQKERTPIVNVVTHHDHKPPEPITSGDKNETSSMKISNLLLLTVYMLVCLFKR